MTWQDNAGVILLATRFLLSCAASVEFNLLASRMETSTAFANARTTENLSVLRTLAVMLYIVPLSLASTKERAINLLATFTLPFTSSNEVFTKFSIIYNFWKLIIEFVKS